MGLSRGLALLVFAVCVWQVLGAGRRALRGESCSANLRYKPPPRGTPPSALKMKGHRIVNKENNNEVLIRGINWFGFNVGMGMVDGLWAGGTEAATDFALITYQLRLLGFNAVRLPFIWRDLEMAPKNLDKDCTPVTVDFLKRRLISPHVTDKYIGKPLPGNVAPSPHRDGYCNTYLTDISESGYDRLMFVIQAFIAQGIYVVLDYQPMGLEQHAKDLNVFVTAWESLWKKVACLPNFDQDLAGRIFVDVMNEPDSMQVAWEPKNGMPGAHQLYLGVADALWDITPRDVLFMFEGTGQNRMGLNWGNGFITDRQTIDNNQLSDPNGFFQDLLQKPYKDHVVMTPHVYPPSITMSTFLDTALWDQCKKAFGYLQTKGYCGGHGNGKCKIFPVLIGETGSAFETNSDKQWLQDFADFLNAEGGARAYNSIPLNGWMWWAYNENSGDTGGIVHNQWQDFNWEKLNWLIARMGLRPWYLRD